MPYIHFSEQEKQAANEADIASYLKSIGEPIERHGREYWWESPAGKVTIKGSELTNMFVCDRLYANKVACYVLYTNKFAVSIPFAKYCS